MVSAADLTTTINTPIVDGGTLRMSAVLSVKGSTPTYVSPGRDLVLVDENGGACAPVTSAGTTGGPIPVTGSTAADVEFHVPEGADPSTYSLFVIDETGMAVARYSAGSPEPTTRPANQCPGVTIDDPSVAVPKLTRVTEAPIGSPAAVTVEDQELGAILVAAPAPTAAAKSRADAPGPLISTTFEVVNDPELDIYVSVDAFQLIDDENNLCPLWSAAGQDPEFVQTPSQENGQVSLEFIASAVQVPDGARVVLNSGYTEPATKEQLTIIWS
ncbi:hypothetical protein EK0264_08480 [Epidermidibacterium keratini]|uniref:Uncharacterized protein n=1 Tax=Epidermidibacterium keratini TaxID=1891644 RepID=A0A7L4YMM9_9ACTN|nr:hypothetical protein [Epidermidibacterium keratini]QHC00312.1 hypothetical protein EK0264_08480 [Epidermidibacterium keratini]